MAAFSHYGLRLWNRLGLNLRATETVDVFKIRPTPFYSGFFSLFIVFSLNEVLCVSHYENIDLIRFDNRYSSDISIIQTTVFSHKITELLQQ